MAVKNESFNIFRGSEHYSKLLESFSHVARLQEEDIKRVSEAMFFHICTMKCAGWRHKVKFGRGRKHSFSELFQDIVAFYIKASLPKCYKVELETKKGKTQVDIAIKRGRKYWFLIEVKTNLGYDRLDEDTPKGLKAIKQMKDRLDQLKANFDGVPENNIIYVLEDVDNVGKKFRDRFWAKSKNDWVHPSDSGSLFSKIYPLFATPDPFYWRWQEGEKQFNKNKHYKKPTDKRIRQETKGRIVTRFEDIIKRITGVAV